MSAGVFTLDLNEKFTRLSRPPIVEAVIHWQARATHALDLDSLDSDLTVQLPQYPVHEPIQRWGASASPSDQETAPVVHRPKELQGIRLKSTDQRSIVQFLRDGLVFSRTQEYEHWETFVTAAKGAWKVFMEIANPVETQRLGVRFINHITEATCGSMNRFLKDPPTRPSELPLDEFIYQSKFSVPGYPFGIRVIKVMQPSMQELRQSSGLFIDIDVFSTRPIPNDAEALDDALAKMRWLKNKVFFTLLTDDALKSFI